MKILFFIFLFLVVSLRSQAKRMAPEKVKSIVSKGIQYSVPQFAFEAEGMKHNGGYIEATNVKTKKRIWLKEVYTVVYKADLEEDVQDNFITSIKIQGKDLLVIDEGGNKYKVSID